MAGSIESRHRKRALCSALQQSPKADNSECMKHLTPVINCVADYQSDIFSLNYQASRSLRLDNTTREREASFQSCSATSLDPISTLQRFSKLACLAQISHLADFDSQSGKWICKEGSSHLAGSF